MADIVPLKANRVSSVVTSLGEFGSGDTIGEANGGTGSTTNVQQALRDFSQKTSTTTGLTYGYRGGSMRADNVTTTVNDGTVALTASNTNYIECTGAGVVSANIVGFTSGRFPMSIAVAGASTITSVTDKRSFGSVGSVGSSGAYTARFNTGNLTITTNTSLTAIAHGLGSVPKTITAWLVCQTTEAGYAVGDMAPMLDQTQVAICCDATNINVRYQNSSTVFSLNNKSSVGSTLLTNANWRLQIEVAK